VKLDDVQVDNALAIIEERNALLLEVKNLSAKLDLVREQAILRRTHYPEVDPNDMGWSPDKPYRFTRCGICGTQAKGPEDEPWPAEKHHQFCVLAI